MPDSPLVVAVEEVDALTDAFREWVTYRNFVGMNDIELSEVILGHLAKNGWRLWHPGDPIGFRKFNGAGEYLFRQAGSSTYNEALQADGWFPVYDGGNE